MFVVSARLCSLCWPNIEAQTTPEISRTFCVPGMFLCARQEASYQLNTIIN